MKQMYVCEGAGCFRSNNIVIVNVIKETPQTFMIDDYRKNAYGDYQYLPSRLSKHKYHIFHNFQDALLFLMEQADVDVDRCRGNLLNAQQKYTDLAIRYKRELING